jgi:asparagine synthetase B (glutamine-hydrolysing)
MCGIAGLAYRRAHDFRQEAERRVQTMIDVQAHRGPDGEGLWSTMSCAARRRTSASYSVRASTEIMSQSGRD